MSRSKFTARERFFQNLPGCAATLFSLFLAFTPCLGLAKPDPVLPLAEQDEKLLEEIREGQKDEKCLLTMKDGLAAYQKELQEVIELGKTADDSEIQKAESKLKTNRNKFLEDSKKCLPCRIHEVEDWPKVGKGHWYFTDGSCALPIDDKKELTASFDRARTSLRTPADYLKIPNLVKLGIANSDQTAIDKTITSLPDKFYAFLAIRTPLEFLGLVTTFYYYIENIITEGKDAAGNATFDLVFHNYEKGLKPPAKLDDEFYGNYIDEKGNKKHKPSYYTTVGGRKVKLNLIKLQAVKGRWFISEAGSMRYATFGNFITKDNSIRDQAGYILLEALLRMYHAATGVEL
jgi:hypothetical protein